MSVNTGSVSRACVRAYVYKRVRVCLFGYRQIHHLSTRFPRADQAFPGLGSVRGAAAGADVFLKWRFRLPCACSQKWGCRVAGSSSPGFLGTVHTAVHGGRAGHGPTGRAWASRLHLLTALAVLTGVRGSAHRGVTCVALVTGDAGRPPVSLCPAQRPGLAMALRTGGVTRALSAALFHL